MIEQAADLLRRLVKVSTGAHAPTIRRVDGHCSANWLRSRKMACDFNCEMRDDHDVSQLSGLASRASGYRAATRQAITRLKESKIALGGGCLMPNDSAPMRPVLGLAWQVSHTNIFFSFPLLSITCQLSRSAEAVASTTVELEGPPRSGARQ